MVIYFTGTGNSRYIAQQIAKQLGDSLTDASQCIKEGQTPAFTSEMPYVFVSPVYAWRMPRVFEDWLRRCTFVGTQQAYFVLTCGDSIGAAATYVKKFADSMELSYMGTAQVIMPENYLVMFDPTPQEEDERIVTAATERVATLCQQIAAGTPLAKEKITFTGHLCSDIVTPFFYAFYIGAKKFYATDACVSCGQCADNCMLNNIAIKGGKPTWGSHCTHCMACICQCPVQAIEYGKNTKGRRRYVFPKTYNS